MVNLEEIKKNKSVEELLEFSIINIDKPSGPTSFQISDFICKKLGLSKTSHFGTLDPQVTGVLPIALSRACKLTGYFLGEDKEYVGVARFHKEIKKAELEKVIQEKFLGKLMQKPPVKSRVKREFRQREIYSFNILEQKGTDFLFKVKCQGGTYIRKLIDDLGIELKIGAHMLELRRINAGIFCEEEMEIEKTKISKSFTLYEFENALLEYKEGNPSKLKEMLIPAEIIFLVNKEVQLNVNSQRLKQIFTGKPILNSDLKNKEKIEKMQIISVFNKNELIGIYEVINGKEIFAQSKFVKQPIK